MSQRGDRNFVQISRLRGNCLKCGYEGRAAQIVEKHTDYALLKHHCHNCGRMLRVQRYPLATIEQKAKVWM